MQNQKSKITYWVNGETVTEQEFINLTGEYFKYFEGSDVKAVDYSSVESLFDGDFKSQRQINEHLREVLGESKTAGNSTRHKYTGEGGFHKESDFKDDVITSSNRGEKEMIEKFKEILIPFKNGSEQVKVRVCSPQCFCDGSCKKEVEEPFSIQVPKPKAFNQSDFFDKKQSEQEILDTFKRNMEKIDKYNYIANFSVGDKEFITKEFETTEEAKEYFNKGDFSWCIVYDIVTGKFVDFYSKNKNKKEGAKETEGKLNYELDWQFIQQLAERMSHNKGKYEPYNWTKPMDVEKLKQSLFRHVIEVMKGNYSDDGREFGHFESIALNAMMINYQLKNNV